MNAPAILIVTNRTDYTADYVILQLKKLSLPFVRFNTEDFPALTKSTVMFNPNELTPTRVELKIKHRRIVLSELKGVWYRRPSPPDLTYYNLSAEDSKWVDRECRSFVNSIWEISNCALVSSPANILRAENKALQLSIACEIGLTIPKTLITNDPAEIRKVSKDRQREWICKPFWSGGYDSKDKECAIFTERLAIDESAERDESLQCAPMIVQEAIPKEYDSRVTVFGEQVFAVRIQQFGSEKLIDWRKAEQTSLRHTPYQLDAELEQMCVTLVSRLGLRFGAIDFVVDRSGVHYFLEINPNGQWAWLEMECGLPMTDSLVRVLTDGN